MAVASVRVMLSDRIANEQLGRLGLPSGIVGCLFDLDGVLTQTARAHAAAWKLMFDAFLHARALRTGEAFVPFDVGRDYLEFIDGKQRADGVRSFLASREVWLPEGSPADAPAAETVTALAARKNELVLAMIEREGVEAYAGSVRYLRAVRAAGLSCAVVSASSNCRRVLEMVGIAELFEARVDGLVAARERLPGKPAPDTYLAAAQMLEVPPAQAAVFEDAFAGVEAARAGGFGYVVGVARRGEGAALRARGADIVVADLGELLELR